MDVCRTGGTEAVAGNCWGHATQGVGAGTGWSPRDTGIPGVCTCSEQAGKRVARLAGTGHSFYVLGSRAGLGLIHSWRTHTHTHTPYRPPPVEGLLAQGDG